MFGRDKIAVAKTAKIDHIVDMLSSVKMHLVHGRGINGSTARSDLKLRVNLLGKSDPLWKRVWEYYSRAEIHLAASRAPKMFETREEALTFPPQ